LEKKFLDFIFIEMLEEEKKSLIKGKSLFKVIFFLNKNVIFIFQKIILFLKNVDIRGHQCTKYNIDGM